MQVDELEVASLFPELSMTYSLSAMVVIGPLLTGVLGAVVIGQEFRYGTWSSMLTMGASRAQIYLAKVLAVMSVTAIWVLSGLAVAFALSSVFSGRIVLPHINHSIVAQLLTVTFNLLFWSLVSFSVAAWGRSAAAGVVAGLGLPWAEMMVYGINSVRDFMPVWNQRALNAAAFSNVPDGMVNIAAAVGSPSTGLALAVLVAELAIVLLGGWIAIRRPIP